MRGVLLSGVLLVAGAARAQSLVVFDDTFENGFSPLASGVSYAILGGSSECHSGPGCLYVTFPAGGVGDLDISGGGLNLLAYDGIDVWVRADTDPTDMSLQLISRGSPIGVSLGGTIYPGYTHFPLPWAAFGQNLAQADAVRFTSDGDGGSIVLDDVTLFLAGDAGLGGGAGGGGEPGTGGGFAFGGGDFSDPGGGGDFQGFGGGGDFTFPPGKGGGTGQFGGGADLGCNCEASSPISDAMTALFGLAVWLQLRRRSR